MANWSKLPSSGYVEDRRRQPMNPLRQARMNAQATGQWTDPVSQVAKGVNQLKKKFQSFTK